MVGGPKFAMHADLLAQNAGLDRQRDLCRPQAGIGHTKDDSRTNTRTWSWPPHSLRSEYMRISMSAVSFLRPNCKHTKGREFANDSLEDGTVPLQSSAQP